MTPNKPTNAYEIIEGLRTFASNHKQIQAFDVGPMDEADVAKLSAAGHPLMYVTLLDALMDEGTAEISLEILIGTLQPPDLESRVNVQSNMLYIMKDIIAFLKHHDYDDSFVPRVTLDLPVTAEAFVYKLDNLLVGFTSIVRLQFDNTNDLCLVPD